MSPMFCAGRDPLFIREKKKRIMGEWAIENIPYNILQINLNQRKVHP